MKSISKNRLLFKNRIRNEFLVEQLYFQINMEYFVKQKMLKELIINL